MYWNYKTSNRAYSWQDKCLSTLDEALRVLFTTPLSKRETPAKRASETPLSATEKQKSARLLRVDHAGEIAAQALYQGQAFVAKHSQLQRHLKMAAREEEDHLAWCAQRLSELSSHVSYLNPIWYLGSFLIGAMAGLAGNAWSLGFIVETENQVVRHLEEHLNTLSSQDHKSRAILEQMKEDETHHATTAFCAGAREPPLMARQIMREIAKIMTKTAYWM